MRQMFYRVALTVSELFDDEVCRGHARLFGK